MTTFDDNFKRAMASAQKQAESHTRTSRKPTIYEALWEKLGRMPTNDELRADVERIKTSALVETATRGKLRHQQRRR
jgi:hypothetical protein